MPAFTRITIVGVGLIGGSIGLALRRRGLARWVRGVVRRTASGEVARACGAVDEATANLVEGVQGADLVVVATPVDQIVDTVRSVAYLNPQALVTDVGSTKALICRLLREPAPADLPQRRPGPGQFVGSHPLAGDHRSGPEHARADLLEGRMVVVTPEEASPPAAVERLALFWRELGAEVELLDPEEHDRALAATSHLPHLVASALAAATPETWLRFTARGWSDTTRIAASSPELWSQIFTQNRSAVIDAVQRLQHALDALRDAVAREDRPKLLHLLEEAKRRRDAVGD